MGLDFFADDNLNITFEIGDQSGNIRCTSIDIIDDSGVECDHDFSVFSGDIECNVYPAIQSTVPSVTVTIEDNDSN